MLVEREIQKSIKRLAAKFPVVMISGPRQSGKSTLLKVCFPKHEYVSLENMDVRAFAQADPRGFLNQFTKGAILDEVQRVPELFSYMQEIVDNRKKSGLFILSGSQNFLLMKNVSQSLAGRVAVLKLLPFSIAEIQEMRVSTANPYKLIFQGFYPRLYDKRIKPADFYPSYIETYLQRDVRELIRIGDLSKFTMFIKSCAARIGGMLNLSSMANDCGISVPTAKSWLSILEASYVVYLLQPHFQNVNKRLVKIPKLYFYDTGLACSLLNLKNEKQIELHYLKGALFENFVLMELLKKQYNNNAQPSIYFWRDKTGNEIDLMVDRGLNKTIVEIKATETIKFDQTKGISYYTKLQEGKEELDAYVIYTGENHLKKEGISYVSWQNIAKIPTD